MTNLQYFTCDELIHRYPLTKLWGWNAVKIGVFYNCLLVDGKKFGKKSRTMITESSFKNLMDFTIEILSYEDCSENFMSYGEILEIIPQAVYYRWTPTIIGILYHSKLLYGRRSKEESRTLIKVSSALHLIEYTGQRFERIRSKK